jgi:putative ABC transport system substrate-binding protein
MVFAWPLAALAQRTTLPFIGFLNAGSPNERAHLVDAFRQGLKEGGYVDGKDVAIEYRWAEGRQDRLPQLAQELVARKVALIVASGGMAPALAAKSATATIPIIFSGGSDPVQLGLVASLSRPGGNITGVTNISISLNAKRLQILHEIVPDASSIACLMNPDAADAKESIKDIEAAAEASATRIKFLQARNDSELDAAFANMQRLKLRALLVAANQYFVNRREKIVALAARHAIPASYPFSEFPIAGGLLSYGPHLADAYRQAGIYAARVLKGAKPADLPVIQATKLELVVNLKTAKNLGLTLSRDFLARVDEVIQ